jgi:hypothetical protein
MAKKLTQYDVRRREKRNALWDDAEAAIYNKREESGFCTVPRTLPLMTTLIKHLSPKKDPSRVYLDLWFRQRDDGFVESEDQEEMAACSGYPTGTRNVRTWRERLEELERLGFIRIKPKGTQKYRYILLLHPHDVVQRIRHKTPAAIPDWWWGYFESRIRDIRAELRWTPEVVAAGDFDDFPGALNDEDDDLPF